MQPSNERSPIPAAGPSATPADTHAAPDPAKESTAGEEDPGAALGEGDLPANMPPVTPQRAAEAPSSPAPSSPAPRSADEAHEPRQTAIYPGSRD